MLYLMVVLRPFPCLVGTMFTATILQVCDGEEDQIICSSSLLSGPRKSRNGSTVKTSMHHPEMKKYEPDLFTRWYFMYSLTGWQNAVYMWECF